MKLLQCVAPVDPTSERVFAGENVARGDVSLPEIIQTWMKSKLHRENILAAEFSETGIGLARDGMGEMYYTQVFATPQR